MNMLVILLFNYHRYVSSIMNSKDMIFCNLAKRGYCNAVISASVYECVSLCVSVSVCPQPTYYMCSDRTLLSICMGHSGGDRYFVCIVHSRWNEVA